MKKKREANEKSEGRPRERRYFTRCGDRMGTHSLSCSLSLVRKKMNYLGVIRKLKMLSMGALVKIKLQAIGMKAYR